MDPFGFSQGSHSSPHETFFAMLHQYLLQSGCSQSASMLVEEAKVQFNNNDASFSEAYMYEWWCLLWQIHSSSRSPTTTNMPPPPMPFSRVDPRSLPAQNQQQQHLQQQQLYQQQLHQHQQQLQRQQQFAQTPQNPQNPQMMPVQMQPHQQQPQQQQPGQMPPNQQKQQPGSKKGPERTPQTVPKVPSSATTPVAHNSAPQQGSESSAIMVPGQAPLTVGKRAPGAAKRNSQAHASRPQIQPQQSASRRPSSQRTPQARQQPKPTAPNSQPSMSMANVPVGGQSGPRANSGYSMSPMGSNQPSGPQSVPPSGLNPGMTQKQGTEQNQMGFAPQPQGMVGGGGHNGDSAGQNLALNGPSEGLNMDADFGMGMNFLTSDLNMDLNGFDMASMLK